jgi:hypothetical protein
MHLGRRSLRSNINSEILFFIRSFHTHYAHT